MADLLRVAQGAVSLGFALLAVLALVRAPRLGQAGWWAAAAFGSLAVGLSAFWVPGWVGLELLQWAEQLQLVLIISFPYLLLRFAATFRPLPRALEVAAAAAAAASCALVFAPEGPDAGWYELLVLAVILGYWTGVSAVTVVRLWRAGSGQPGVARRRMRLMAAAAAVLTVAVVAALQLGGRSQAMELSSYVFTLASAVAFGLGFAPPQSLRLLWRQHEDEQLQAATRALLRASTVEDIAAHLLPATAGIMGASGATLVDPAGTVVAAHGQAPEPGETVPADDGSSRAPLRETADLGEGHGRLVVWTSAYTPFFGPEELRLFSTLSAIGGLALERAAMLGEERSRRIALEQARAESDAARIEAERAREDADQANLAKSEFLSRMSHELRTPLNAILGFGQLLELAALDEEDHGAVDHILKAGRHLLALINDVLDLSRIEAGALTLSLEPVHSGELIADSIAMIQPLASARAIEIDADLAGCDDYVRTDRQRCRQALLNLLSNAVKYNRDGGRVEVTCVRDGARLRIAVRDTGPGIDPERRDRLFEPFDRLGAEASGVEGTGLGLALTKQLVERLGGEIGLDSSPGEGSTFWLDLPVTEALAEASGPETAPDLSLDGQHRLLLVEDNLANLRVVEAMLRHRPGISVLPAMQGMLALELAYEHRPDVIVLDLHLPDLTGREVLTRLKADPRTRAIPVIIASADATRGSIRRLKDDGAFDYITKPLDLHQFLGLVDRALHPDR